MALSANQNDLKLFKLLEGSKAYLVMSKQTPVQSSVKAGVKVPSSITVIWNFYLLPSIFFRNILLIICVSLLFLYRPEISYFWGVNQKGWGWWFDFSKYTLIWPEISKSFAYCYTVLGFIKYRKYWSSLQSLLKVMLIYFQVCVDLYSAILALRCSWFCT